MDSKGFQEHCCMLLGRLNENIVNDGDLDTFADIVTNILDREEFRAPGTSYEQLDRRVSEIYEKALIQPMPPLVARLYQICRMFDMYRPRPMTELELRESKEDVQANKPVRYALLVEARNASGNVASCWWESLGGTDDGAKVVAKFAQALGEGDDEAAVVEAFAKVGAGFEMLDEEARTSYPEIPVVADRNSGVIGIKDGIARNAKRHGHRIKVDLDKRSVYADNYMTWGRSYYCELHPETTDSQLASLPVWKGDMTDYRLAAAADVAKRISDMPDVFAMPNSPGQVVTKFASLEA